MTTSARPILAHAALIFANILFGVNYPAYAEVLRSKALSYDQLFFSRVLISGLIFLPLILLNKQIRNITMKQFWSLCIVAVIIVFGRQLLMIWGLTYTSAIDSSTISTLGPALILIISAIMFKRKIAGMKIIAVAVGFAGALLLILGGGHSQTSGGHKILGNILLLISVTASSYNSVNAKRLMSGSLSSVGMVAWYSVIGMVITLPFFLPNFLHINFEHISKPIYYDISYILILGTVLPTLLYYWGIKQLTPLIAGIYFNIQPIVATILAVARHQDKFTIINGVSMMLIFASVTLISLSYRKQKTHDVIPHVS